jgi:hypothetical protein
MRHWEGGALRRNSRCGIFDLAIDKGKRACRGSLSQTGTGEASSFKCGFLESWKG